MPSVRLIAALLTVIAGGMPALAQDGTGPHQAGAAILGALDKITGRVSDIIIPVGASDSFFRLEIEVMSCQQQVVNQRPESAAFLVITETPLEGDPVRRFSGWMFASSPSISAMDHPIYDVWVVGCTDASPAEPEPENDAEPESQDE